MNTIHTNNVAEILDRNHTILQRLSLISIFSSACYTSICWFCYGELNAIDECFIILAIVLQYLGIYRLSQFGRIRFCLQGRRPYIYDIGECNELFEYYRLLVVTIAIVQLFAIISYGFWIGLPTIAIYVYFKLDEVDIMGWIY